MGEFFRKLSTRWANLRYFLTLGIICLGLFAGFSTMGCGSGCGSSGSSGGTTTSTNTTKVPSEPVSIIEQSQTINPKSAYQPNDQVDLSIKARWEEGNSGTIVWNPPVGATNVTFNGIRPEEGGPPYSFANLTLEQAQAGIQVSYNAPSKSDDDDDFVDILMVESAGENSNGMIVHKYANQNQAPETRRLAAAPLGQLEPVSDQPQAASAPVDAWKVIRWTDVAEAPTQATCESIVEQGQTANAFMAWRAPVDDQIAANQVYTLPVLMNGSTETDPAMYFTAGAIEIMMPLEIRMGATQWANQYLPPADGELWVALGLDPDATIDCADDLWGSNPTSYSMITSLAFDLSSRPDGCEDCILPAYACYKTGNMPAAAARAMAKLFTNTASLSVGDYTCVGPGETPLLTGADWLFETYTESLVLEPGDEITIHYWVTNKNTTEARTFSFTQSPTLAGVTWTVHPAQDGDDWTPDLTKTVASPITVPAGDWYHLYITGVVPADAEPGQYQYVMTMNGTDTSPESWRGSTIINVVAEGELPDIAATDPSVALSGSAAPAPVAPGSNLTYSLTIDNDGPVGLTDLVLTDALPANTTYVSCLGGDSCSHNSGTVTWELASLGAGLSHTMQLVVQVNAGASAPITNTTYSVETGESISANGATITTAVSGWQTFYLPHIRK